MEDSVGKHTTVLILTYSLKGVLSEGRTVIFNITIGSQNFSTQIIRKICILSFLNLSTVSKPSCQGKPCEFALRIHIALLPSRPNTESRATVSSLLVTSYSLRLIRALVSNSGTW